METTETVKNWEDVAKGSAKFRRLAVWSGVPISTFETHRLCQFIPWDGTEMACRAALDFVAGTAGHHFLTFVGETGREKTHLAVGIAWHWLENDMGLVKYYQADSLLDDLRRGYNLNDPERQLSFE